MDIYSYYQIYKIINKGVRKYATKKGNTKFCVAFNKKR